MPSIPHIKVDQPITADLLNRIADRLEPWSKMTVAQGSHLNFMAGPFGKALVLMLPREIPARLIGTSSPYAWTALTEEPDGAYADRTGGLLGGAVAYELNGKADLDGKVVMLRWTAAGDWRFAWVGYGTPDFAWTFNVNGCMGTGLAGATIELRQAGVLIDSCVTADGTGGTTLGRCVLTVPGGTYDVTITGPSGAGYDDASLTTSISGAATTNTTLTVDGGHFCLECGDCDAYPNQVAVTFTYGPDYTGANWPDSTLTWEPLQNAWRSAIFLMGSSERRLRLECDPLQGYVLSWETVPFGGGGGPFAHVDFHGASTTCVPFYIPDGIFDFDPSPDYGSWTGVGL